MRKIVILFISLLLENFAYPFEIKNENFEYAGFLKTEVWLKINNDNQHLFLSSFKNTFDLETEYKISENWVFFTHLRYYYDFAYDIRNRENFDRNQSISGHTPRTHWLRDCYLDFNSDKLDLRLGKQQVVWGQTDIPILDRVMPLDLSWWWLRDLEEIRIPLWMIKAEYLTSLNSTLQVLIIPDFEANRSAPAYDTFSFRSVNAFYDFKNLMKSLGGNVIVKNYSVPKKFKNSTFGVRWRSIIPGFDLEYTFNYLYGYTYSAYTYFEGVKNIKGIFGALPIADYYYSRRHKRYQLFGFSFAKSFVEAGILKGLTLKGEFCFIHKEPAYYGISGSRVITENTDKYNWGLALERYIFTNWLVNLQLLQFRTKDFTKQGYKLLDTATYGIQDKYENYLILKVMTDFMHERLKPELLILWQDDNSGRIVSKVKYELRENIWLKLGVAHFFGELDTPNGEFRNKDQLFFEVKYTF